MSTVAGALLVTFLGSAAAPGALVRELDGAAARGLPLGFARTVAADLVPRVHQRKDWVAALYVPATTEEPPTLLVSAAVYLDGFAWKPLRRLTVDAAEGLFHALLVAHLGREVIGTRSPYAAALRARAEVVMAEVPPDHRLEAQIDALASFGAHLLSLANETERKAARGPEAAAALCRRLEAGHPFFRLWDQAFADGFFPGSWDPGGGDGAPLRHSRSSIDSADRRALVRAVLGAEWRGDAAADLGPLVCQSRREGDEIGIRRYNSGSIR